MSKGERPTKPSGISWLGEVPAHWEVSKLKHAVSRVSSGGTPESNNSAYWTDDESGIHWVSIADMTKQYLVEETEKCLTDEGLHSKGLEVYPQGTLLYSMYASLGKVAVLGTKATVNQAILALVPDPRKAEQPFLSYWLRSVEPHLKLFSSSNTQDNLSAGKVKAMPILLPPLPEQRAIAAFLDERTSRIDGLIARKNRLVQLLKERRQALITRAVTRGLNPNVKLKPSGVPWLGEVPVGWEVVPLRHIAASIQTGPFGSQLHEADYVEGGIPLINPAHMVQGEIIPEAESAVDEATKERLARYVLETGDILFARRGEIGRCAKVSEHQAGWMCGTGSMRLRLADSDPGYYSILFGSKWFAEALELNAVGTTMLNINPTILARQYVPRPPHAEQTAIREFIAITATRIDGLINKVEAAIERLQEYRSALISAAVTGKVAV